MTCEICNGTGKDGEAECNTCEGNGALCDSCGEPCEISEQECCDCCLEADEELKREEA